MEAWVDSYIFPEAYEVSTLGRVRSKSIMVKNSRNDSFKRRKGRIISQSYCAGGNYLKCTLSYQGQKVALLVHRLIAFSFLKGDLSLTVNHKNAKKSDNRVENLEIVSIQDNQKHAKQMGLLNPRRGSESGASKIDEKIARKIKKLRSLGYSYDKIASETGSTNKIVGDICRGRTWNHV